MDQLFFMTDTYEDIIEKIVNELIFGEGEQQIYQFMQSFIFGDIVAEGFDF